MGKKLIAIYDEEENYAKKLMDYINKKENGLKVQMFTDFEKLKEFLIRNPISLLLISKKMITESLKELEHGQVLILSKELKKDFLDDYPSINKYQSSEKIIKEILKYYKPSYELLDSDEDIGGAKLIGIYSPIKRCLKTSFALVSGQIYGENYKTLYLNLERFSGIEALSGRRVDGNLSDVMYYFREKKEGVIEKLEPFVERMGRMDYIAPALNPEDIEDIESNEWQMFFRVLLNKSSYKIIIVDFGEGIRGTYDILKMCNTIFMPVKSDQMSTIKIEEYEKYLKATEREEILEKTIKCKLNREGKIGIKDNYVEQLMQGDFKMQVEEILDKEGAYR